MTLTQDQKRAALRVLAGGQAKMLCPFHHENTPSLSVDYDKGVWHCFGCGLGGSAIDWVMYEAGRSKPIAEDFDRVALLSVPVDTINGPIMEGAIRPPKEGPYK